MSLDKKILTAHEQDEHEQMLNLAGERFMEEVNDREYASAIAYFNRLNTEAQSYIKKHPEYHWGLLIAANEIKLKFHKRK
jgi:hypothetical protein